MEKNKRIVRFKINMTPFEKLNTAILLFMAVMIFIGVMWMGGTLIGYGGLSSDTYYGRYKPMVIISESMTPTIEVNGLLYVEDAPFSELGLGDIIVFDTIEYGLVGHRIIKELDYGFKTQGDNNRVEDNWIVTEDMYKGRVAEIHNEYADIITLLFGDLDNLSLNKLFLGFILLAVFITFIIVMIRWCYYFIFVYYFLKKSSEKGGKNVLNEYYPYLDNEKEDEIISLFDKLNGSKTLLQSLRLRYDILKLHNILVEEQRVKRKFKNICEIVRKDLE